ncbi:NADP-dependent oxidoreductase [Kocuria carniphila]|uniref:NADP-dependent oxidoreductase n=1 Tax=Kocuria carniphila TaxID=262208 RepID=UPI0028EFBA56|nr:NADP-dependent oxidoreductase [Kocuria carniphila]
MATTETPTETRQIVLASRPHGTPTDENFRLETAAIPTLKSGQILVQNEVMSVDPYMRGRMNDAKSYIPPFQIDEPLEGTAVGTVIASESDSIKVGDHVSHMLGWREFSVVDDDAATVVDVEATSPSKYLGILGMPGLTAYVGLTEIAKFKKGDVVFVSGAAGAVGSAVGQIAKALGASKVIGSAGSAEKIARIKELGFDEAFNYKDGDVAESLTKAAPDGIDVYYDNVGGDHLQAAIGALRKYGRVAMCGAVSQYNNTEPEPGPNNLFLAVGKELNLRGFIVGNHYDLAEEFHKHAIEWLQDGTLQADETFRDGLENAPQAFIDLLGGANTGKMVVRL